MLRPSSVENIPDNTKWKNNALRYSVGANGNLIDISSHSLPTSASHEPYIEMSALRSISGHIEHTYLDFELQNSQDPNCKSRVTYDDYDDSLYVIPHLKSNNENTNLMSDAAKEHSYDECPTPFQSSALYETDAHESFTNIGFVLSEANVPTDIEDPSYIQIDDFEEHEDPYSTPYEDIPRSPSSKVESQYTPIETEMGMHYKPDRMCSIDSIEYQSDSERLNHLVNFHKDLRTQHPCSPSSTMSTATSQEVHCHKHDTDKEECFSDTSPFNSIESATEDRLTYLMNLHSDIQNETGDYCTWSQNKSESLQDNSPGYLNMSCEGVTEEEIIADGTERAEVSKQNKPRRYEPVWETQTGTFTLKIP
ncbi:uncharacterized protein [Amphiura filiformis]|uniref:uncharacterized protein isoform X1 n=1 Tax=Amphiura filiformis TaxID=82378 RepID=UPI003B20F30D